MKAKAKPTFEKSLNRLTAIVEALEEDMVSLDKSLALYKEGLELSKQCSETLSHYETEILLLQNTEQSTIRKIADV